MLAAIGCMKKFCSVFSIGVQSGFGVCPDVELFNLVEVFPSHPRLVLGSTVTRQSLEKLGYSVFPLQFARKISKPGGC